MALVEKIRVFLLYKRFFIPFLYKETFTYICCSDTVG